MGVDAGTPPGLWDRVRTIAAEEVARFARSGFLRNASITDGGLTLRGGFLKLLAAASDVTTFYVGPLSPKLPDGSSQPGLIVRRNDGSIAMAMYDPNPSATGYFQFLAWYDRSGNIVMSDDTDSGQGIARPYVGGSFYKARYADWGVMTVAGEFETLWRGEMFKQHPKMSVATLAAMDMAGATGEVRVLVDGVQMGATSPIVFAQKVSLFGPAAVAGPHMKSVAVEIQGRRTSALGALRVEPLHLLGRQS